MASISLSQKLDLAIAQLKVKQKNELNEIENFVGEVLDGAGIMTNSPSKIVNALFSLAPKMNWIGLGLGLATKLIGNKLTRSNNPSFFKKALGVGLDLFSKRIF